MEISDYSKEEILILTVKGRLDAVTSNDLKEVLTDFVEKGRKLIVFDLHALEYISSAGIRVLYQGLNMVEDRKGRMAISGPIESVKKVFEMVDLSSDIPIHKDIDSATKGLT